MLNLDFGPTILDLAGVDIPEDMQGNSFAPVIWGQEMNDWRDAMYYHFYEEAYNIGEHEGIRTDQYKLIHFSYPEDGWQLFYIIDDPTEMNNLIGDRNFAATHINLQKRMDSLKQIYHYK